MQVQHLCSQALTLQAVVVCSSRADFTPLVAEQLVLILRPAMALLQVINRSCQLTFHLHTQTLSLSFFFFFFSLFLSISLPLSKFLQLGAP